MTPDFHHTDGTAQPSPSPPDLDGLVVAIPAYDAARSVSAVVEHAGRFAETVLVVDDGSQDGTGERASEAGAVVVTHPENRGYGAALKTIFTEADALGAEYLVVLDADGQHDVEDIPSLVAPLAAGEADVVIGSRFAEGGRTDAPYYRRVGLWVINLLTNLSLGTVRGGRIRDTQSGYRAYNAPAMASLAAATDAIDDRMSASLDILYHLLDHGFVVREVGTNITYDVEEASTENPLTHGMELLAGIARRTFRNRSLVSATSSFSLRRR